MRLSSFVRKASTREEQIARGTKIEMEHEHTIRWIQQHPEASLEECARRISTDHVDEREDYYDVVQDVGL